MLEVQAGDNIGARRTVLEVQAGDNMGPGVQC